MRPTNSTFSASAACTIEAAEGAPRSVAAASASKSVLFSAVSDSNGCRSRRGAAETRVVVPGVLSANGERINEWASADSFIRFGFVDRDATVGAAVLAWSRMVRMRRVVRARTAIGGRARFSVVLMCLCFIGSSFTSTGSVQVLRQTQYKSDYVQIQNASLRARKGTALAGVGFRDDVCCVRLRCVGRAPAHR